MAKKIAYVSLEGLGGIHIRDIPVKDIEFGDGGYCLIRDTKEDIIVTHLSNVIYLEYANESETDNNAEEKE